MGGGVGCSGGCLGSADGSGADGVAGGGGSGSSGGRRSGGGEEGGDGFQLPPGAIAGAAGLSSWQSCMMVSSVRNRLLEAVR